MTRSEKEGVAMALRNMCYDHVLLGHDCVFWKCPLFDKCRCGDSPDWLDWLEKKMSPQGCREAGE